MAFSARVRWPLRIARRRNAIGIRQLGAAELPILAKMRSTAAREEGHPDFQSIRFLMSFAGATSPMMQRYIREFLGPEHRKITIPTIIFGSRYDPMLANAEQMAADLFERCELAIVDEKHPLANHPLPEKAECYERIVSPLGARL